MSTVTRSPARRRRHGRAPRGDVPARVGHRRPQAAGAAGDRRPRTGAPRRLLRRARVDRHDRRRPGDRRGRARGGHPHLHRAGRRRARWHPLRGGRRHRRRFAARRRVGRDRAEGEPPPARSPAPTPSLWSRRERPARRRCGSTASWSTPPKPACRRFDHGLLVGDGVFETIRVYGGEPFAWTRHLDRLAHSAAGLGLAVPDRDELRARGRRGARRERATSEARLRITVTGGVAPLGSERGDGRPDRDRRRAARYDRGRRRSTSSWCRGCATTAARPRG